MGNKTPCLVFLDFLITMVGAFAVYSTNFIAYSNSIPIIGSLYGVLIATRGFLPLIIHKDRLFRNLPILHLIFLATVISASILLNNIVIYLVGISLSLLLGIFTGSYVYNLEVTWSKKLKDPSKFFSIITGSEAAAFLAAPILTYVATDRLLFLSILLALIILALSLLAYFRFLGGVEVKPKFFSGRFGLVRRVLPIALLASTNWLLQYVWMGLVFGLGARQGVPGQVVLGAVEGETLLFMALQFGLSLKGFRSIAKLKLGVFSISAYALLVGLFASLFFIRVSTLVFILLVFSFAPSSFLTEPLVDTLVSMTENSSENSTVVVSFRYLGGGAGYILSSVLLSL